MIVIHLASTGQELLKIHFFTYSVNFSKAEKNSPRDKKNASAAETQVSFAAEVRNKK